MFGWIFGTDLKDKLSQTKSIRVHGVRFKIKKLNPFDYVAGSKALRQIYETSQAATTQDNVEMRGDNLLTIKQHYSEVFLGSVVYPKLKKSESDSGEGIPVDHLMTDWEMANELYLRIQEYTYGKKNFRQSVSQKIGALK
jgi:hypothetical protein